MTKNECNFLRYSVSDTDMLFLGKGVGCATDCYHPSRDESFPNPYPSVLSNPESQNPTHGQLPASANAEQELKYRETCPIQTQSDSDSGSSVSQLSSLHPPTIINGESKNSNTPDFPTIDASQDMIQTGSPYILTAEPVKNSIDESLNPDTYVSTDSTFVTSLEPFWEAITSRSVRNSPRDFRGKEAEQ